jgi:hypothetical protein
MAAIVSLHAVRSSSLWVFRLALLATAASGALAIAPAAASPPARIVIDRSIEGARLGASQRSVRAIRGRPDSVVQCPAITVCVPNASPGTVSWQYKGAKGFNDGTIYEFIKGKVALMADFSRSDRTSAGVGPGVPLKLVKRRYPHVAFHRFAPGRPPSGYYVTPPPTKTGDKFTMLVVASGRVDWVEVGRWNSSSKYVCDYSICS